MKTYELQHPGLWNVHEVKAELTQLIVPESKIWVEVR